MALKVLMLRKKKDNLVKSLEELRGLVPEFEKREKELEDAINEVDESTTEEEQETINENVENLEKDKSENDEKIKDLEEEIRKVEEEIKAAEEKAPKVQEDYQEERGGKQEMTTRSKFFGMNIQERAAFFERDDVKTLISNVRTCIKEKRAIANVGLTIPTVTLPLVNQIVETNSKLLKYVHTENVSGNARQNIMGTCPEGIWVEMYASLNELDLQFNNVEVDGYKVGGFFSVPNAIIEDNDVDLMSKLLEAIGVAIAKATDKAIVYGKGTKMPMGFVTRLSQVQKPSDWAETRRDWVDLRLTNIIKISNKKGLELFKDIILALKAISNDFSTDNLVWIMNKNTHLDLQVEAMSTNMAAAIVSGIGKDTMPVVGGDVVELEFMADGDIAFGYMGLYLLAQRKEVRIGQSEHVKFLDDQTVLKGTARLDGEPVISEGFGILNIKGTEPTTEVLFPLDKANETDVQLESLKIGALNTFPKFQKDTYEYMVNTSNESNKVDVKPVKAAASIAIKNGDTDVENGANTTWVDGENTLKITVSYAGVKKEYTVIVNKTTQGS